MKRENLKKDYEIKEMRKEEIDNLLKENSSYKKLLFENEDDYFMIREDKKNLFIIHQIEKKERRILDKDIKIESRKSENYNVKLIYHRDKKQEKEFRIFISYKNEENKLIRRRLRNQEIDENSRNEKKMIEIYKKISDKEIKKMIL